RERDAQLAGLGLTLEQRGKRRVVEVRDPEHTRQHADGALHRRLHGRHLLLAGRRWRRFGRGLLAEGRRMPRDLEEPLGLGEAFGWVETAVHVLHDAAVGLPELDPTGHVPRRLRDQDLTGPRCRADARGEIYRAADVVAVFLSNRLAGVDADTDLDPGPGLVAVLLGDRPLNRDRAQDGAAGGLEGDHEAVALRLDDVAAVQLDVLPDDLVLLAHELVGNLVAQLFSGVGESADVTEKYGDGVAERHRDFGCC